MRASSTTSGLEHLRLSLQALTEPRLSALVIERAIGLLASRAGHGHRALRTRDPLLNPGRGFDALQHRLAQSPSQAHQCLLGPYAVWPSLRWRLGRGDGLGWSVANTRYPRPRTRWALIS